MIWLNQILQGILLGGYFALLASGLSFLFGVMRLINLAHGSLVVLGAYVMMLIYQGLGISPFTAILPTLIIMAVVGVLLHVVVLERSLRGGLLVPLLATFGLSLVIDNLLFTQFGANTQSFAPDIGALSYGSWAITDQINVAQLDVLTFATALSVLGGMQLMLRHTQLGRMIRATAEDSDAAALTGINVGRIRIAATAIAMVLAGFASSALGMRAGFTPFDGAPQLIFAFEAVVIGGTGSLWGTLVGGMVLGIAQNIGAEINPSFSQLAGHVVFLLVLVARVRHGDRLIQGLRRLLTTRRAA